MIVELLTHIGTRDHYVGAMNGVILSVCPEATLVDITHDVPPQDIASGALELALAYRYFPPGTVFLVVVDPGVGSERRGIAVEAGGYRFVGPDNGVLSLAFREMSPFRAVELRAQKFARATISRTFEGRDRFAPAAAWLARDTDLRLLGPVVVDPVMLEISVATVANDGVDGEVLRVDRFGNLITNIGASLIEELGGLIAVDIGGIRISGVVGTYGDAPPGALCALIGSSGHLEIARNGGSAAEALRAERGAPVRVMRTGGA